MTWQHLIGAILVAGPIGFVILHVIRLFAATWQEVVLALLITFGLAASVGLGTALLVSP